MSYRYMRTLLFFDLPTLTSSDRRNYRKFIKELKMNGFFMVQESVYVKMSIDSQATESTIKEIKKKVPPKGFIMALSITEKQFSSMQILLGEFTTDVIDDDKRMIVL